MAIGIEIVKGGGDEKSLESGDGGGGGNSGEVGQKHLQNNHFLTHFIRIGLLFATLTLFWLVLYHSEYPLQFLPNSLKPSSFSSAQANLSALDKKNIEVDRLLRKAAMKDKTVILTAVNEAWAEPNSVFDLFLKGFKNGNQTQKYLKNLVVIAMDHKAYVHCLAVHPYCYDLNSEGSESSDDEAFFMTTEYLNLIWKRLDFLRTVLNLGYNLIFTDADIIWFRDPFPRFFPDSDFQITCDFYGGNSSDILNNAPNSGFTYVKSNNKTILFYDFWYTSRERFPNQHDQDVFNHIKTDAYVTEIGLQIKLFDTKYFGGFCQPSTDLNAVCTMHANCCVGIDNKIYDLKILLDDWRNYTSMPVDKRTLQPPSWTAPQHCGAPSFHSPRRPKKKNDPQGNTG